MRSYTILNHYTNQSNLKWNCEAEAFGCNHINHLTPWSWIMHIQETSNCSTLLALRLSLFPEELGQFHCYFIIIIIIIMMHHHHHHHHIIFINVIIIIIIINVVVVVWLSSDRQQTIIGSDSGFSPNRQTISEPMMVQFTGAYIRHSASVSQSIACSITGLAFGHAALNSEFSLAPIAWSLSNRYRHPGMFLPLDRL